MKNNKKDDIINDSQINENEAVEETAVKTDDGTKEADLDKKQDKSSKSILDEIAELEKAQRGDAPMQKSEGQKKKEFLWEIFNTLETFCICATVIVLVFSFFMRLTIVDGESMENTLIDQELVLVRTALYEPKQGDIVIIHDPSLGEYYGKPLIKRVIATGGQTIDIDFDTWTVSVDGVIIDEPYVKLTNDQKLTSAWTYPLTVPEGEVFVMGDNRNHSGDSRSAAIGTIDERCVVGKAFVRLFPFEKFGSLTNAQ